MVSIPEEEIDAQEIQGAVPGRQGQPASTGTQFVPGTIIYERYEIIRLLGAGALGSVFLAKDLDSKAEVALKFLNLEMFQPGAVRKRFERFAQIAKSHGHANLVRIYEFGSWQNQELMVREYIKGPSLDQLILERKKQRKHFSIEEVLNIFSDVSHALEAVQSKTYHGCLTPGNILIDDERIVVSDLALARVLQPAQFSSLQIYYGNSYYYLAPEYDRAGSKIDHKVDLYSAAVIAYEMLTGEIPHAPVAPPSTANPEITPEIDQLFLKALSLDPKDRQESLAEFMQQLRDCSADLPPAVAFEVTTEEVLPEEETTEPNMSLSTERELIKDHEETDFKREVDPDPRASTPSPIQMDPIQKIQQRARTLEVEKTIESPSNFSTPELPNTPKPKIPIPPPPRPKPVVYRNEPAIEKELDFKVIFVFIFGILSIGFFAWFLFFQDVFFDFVRSYSKPVPHAAEILNPATETVVTQNTQNQKSVTPKAKADATGSQAQPPKSPPKANPPPSKPPSGSSGGKKVAKGVATTGAVVISKNAQAFSCPGDMSYIDAETFTYGNPDPGRDFLEERPRKIKEQAFCIDQFEWPNIRSTLPRRNVNFQEAKARCAEVGKSLCTETQWELACKGSQEKRFPYGDRYQRGACITERTNIAKSGSRKLCTNSNEVYDLSGNVAEWTLGSLEGGKPDRILRGGSFQSSDWSSHCMVRKNRLPAHRDATTGFRCCYRPE